MTDHRDIPLSPQGTRGERRAPERLGAQRSDAADPAAVQLRHHSRMIVPMLAFAAMLGMINQMSLDPFMSVISHDLDVSVPVLGQVTTLAFIAAAGVSLFAGPLSDFYGKRRILAVGVVAIGLSAFGTLLAPAFIWLLGARLLTAVSAGTVAGTALASAATLYDGDDRRRAMSWIASGLAAGAIVGIPFLTLVASLTSWRGAHGAVTGLALLWVVLMTRFLPDDATADSRPGVGRVLNAYRPFLHQQDTLALVASTAARATAWVGMLTYIGAFLSNEFGLSTTEIGWVYMAGGGGYFTGTKLAGSRLGGFNPRLLNALTTACMGILVGAALTLPGNPETVTTLLVAASLAGGFGWVALVTLISTTSPAGQGTTMSLNSAMFQVGSALGALYGGLLLAVGGYELLGVGLMVSALLAALLVLRPSSLPRTFRLRSSRAGRLSGSHGGD